MRCRIEICLSQMLPAAITACDGAMREMLHPGNVEALQTRLHQLKRVGLLVHIESLLTAFAAEAGMLADMAGMLRFCRDHLEIWLMPTVHSGNLFEVHDIAVHGNRLECSWLIPEALLQAQDRKVALPSRIQLHITMFNQGVNEWQSMAAATSVGGDIQLQNDVNDFNLSVLQDYVQKFCSCMKAIDPQLTSLVQDAVKQVEVELWKRIGRDITLLEMAADLISLLGGGHITVCKSGKDRTGMSITHHQSRWVYGKELGVGVCNTECEAAPEGGNKSLMPADISHIPVFEDCCQNLHAIPVDDRGAYALSCFFRGFGTRLENTLKNTGKRGFAFNALQRTCFPEVYQAPGERCAATES